MLLSQALLTLGFVVFLNVDEKVEETINKSTEQNNNNNNIGNFNLKVERYNNDGIRKSVISQNTIVLKPNDLLRERILKNLDIPDNNGVQINYKQIVIRSQRKNDGTPYIISQVVHEGIDSIINSTKRTSADNIKDESNNNHIATANFSPLFTSLLNKAGKNCEYSKTIVNNNQRICKGQLIFQDDFNELNWDKWQRDIRIPMDTEDADFVSFQGLKQNLYIKYDNLYILPTLLSELPDYDDNAIRSGTLILGPNCTGVINREVECNRQAFAYRILPPIVSARITTKNKFSFKYGIVEIKAKLPKGDWLFPQLFLEPLNNHYGSESYISGQVRLAFIRSNEILKTSSNISIDGSKLFGGVVLSQEDKHREIWMENSFNRNSHYGDNYHVYKTLWTDELISFYVDEKEYGTLYGNFSYEASHLYNMKYSNIWKTGNKMAPFDKEFFISIGVSAGGISDFPDHCISGSNQIDQKPWLNFDSKNELNFWKARYKWHGTWKGEDAALKVDYIRVWAL
ncbi:gram-negative bacteria-binding protein 1-like [Condylostylus longicornis]|uniref:gram-negative bacteria-binding protein 1-like n=1 Tax=Condylostylus longicornis TaxID=2530218 RepID=UPI00244DBC9E|nr:gram-negative bacteria-binding protein 1-like [Condylostylus longicornis]